MEALSGSISAAILDSIKSFNERPDQRSPCEQLSRNAALQPARPSSQAAGPSDRPGGAFFFRDPSIRVAFLGPDSGAQDSSQQQQGPGLVQPAPAQAEGTGVLPLNGAHLGSASPQLPLSTLETICSGRWDYTNPSQMPPCSTSEHDACMRDAGVGPSLQADGGDGSSSSSQTALPCTDLPVNIFAVLARDGYVNK